MKKTLLILFLSILSVSAQVVVFDIHGVLLKERIADFVKQKVQEYIENRGLKNSKPFLKYCSLLQEHKPLSDLTLSLPDPCPILPETYALFSGQVSPHDMYARIKTMLGNATFTNDIEQVAVTTLIDTIFNRDMFLQTLVPLQEGITLLQRIVHHTEHKVYVLSNAPTEWIDIYRDVYDDVFGVLPADHIISSAQIGSLKPEPAVFEYICKHAQCTPQDIVLIDDTKHNVEGASRLGIQGVHFNYENIEDVLSTLVTQKVISSIDQKHIMERLVNNRTRYHQLERTFF